MWLLIIRQYIFSLISCQLPEKQNDHYCALKIKQMIASDLIYSLMSWRRIPDTGYVMPLSAPSVLDIIEAPIRGHRIERVIKALDNSIRVWVRMGNSKVIRI